MSLELTLRAAIDAARSRGDLPDLLYHHAVLADYLSENDREPEAESVRQQMQALEREQASDLPGIAGANGSSPETQRKSFYATSKWPRVGEIPGLSDHQREQLGNALVRPLGILTGTPGTGKTYCVAALVVQLCERYGADAIAVAGPTGKSAVRCHQSLKDYLQETKKDVRLPTPSTIHSLLKIGRNGHDGNGWGFRYDRRNPLPYRYVIVDEMSMAGTSLAATLLAACATFAHVLLVGDTGQLPPVGHGSPLRDLIAAGVPHGELSEIRRNAGLIVRACAAMRRGDYFEPATVFDAAAGLNWRHVEVGDADQILPTVKAMLAGWQTSKRWNPLSDVQVVCAMNDKGPLARQALNRELQDLLNPYYAEDQGFDRGEPGWTPPALEPPRFRTGDKVVCLRNGWYTTEDSPNDTQYVANGEMGVVLDGQYAMTLASFGDRAIVLRPGEWGDFDLGFAVTCHKMQGSSSPVVIAVIDRYANMVCNREWWYTALSRASELVITVGRLSLLRQQAGKPALANRKTFLKTLIEEGMKGEM